MSRGAYDTTDASQWKSSAAQHAINAHHAAQATAQREAEVKQEAEEEAKLIRSKKSRGTMTAKRAAKLQTNGVASPTTTKPESGRGLVLTK